MSLISKLSLVNYPTSKGGIVFMQHTNRVKKTSHVAITKFCLLSLLKIGFYSFILIFGSDSCCLPSLQPGNDRKFSKGLEGEMSFVCGIPGTVALPETPGDVQNVKILKKRTAPTSFD